jgi:asparagine synthase (glutamine-hydrolysing)
MMLALSGRGNNSFGLATSDELQTYASSRQLSECQAASSIVIGYGLDKVFSKDIVQPIASGTSRLAFDGRIYPTEKVSDCERALSWIREKGCGDLKSFVEEVEGTYALATIHGDRLMVARDLLGGKPLYWAEDEDVVAFASEQKALWAIGISSTRKLPPGGVYIVEKDFLSVQKSDFGKQVGVRQTDLSSAASRLSELIVESVKKRSGDSKRVAVAYSGGVDSAVVASSCKLAGLDVELFTVAMKQNDELEHARKSAEAIRLPLTVRQYSMSDLKESIPEVVRRTERLNLMDLAIAIPMFWGSMLAKEKGFQTIFAGQGADELFGGYDRYIMTYQREGLEKASDMMIRDFNMISELNLERDEQATAGLGIELRLPFCDWTLARYVLSLPACLKIGGTEESLQKLVLRRAAQLQGIPRFVYERPKRAVQYGTGIAASIKSLLKQAGLPLEDYLLKVQAESENVGDSENSLNGC